MLTKSRILTSRLLLAKTRLFIKNATKTRKWVDKYYPGSEQVEVAEMRMRFPKFRTGHVGIQYDENCDRYS